jgi:hypothetical protein
MIGDSGVVYVWGKKRREKARLFDIIRALWFLCYGAHKSLNQWLAALVVDKCSFNKAIAVS